MINSVLNKHVLLILKKIFELIRNRIELLQVVITERAQQIPVITYLKCIKNNTTKIH